MRGIFSGETVAQRSWEHLAAACVVLPMAAIATVIPLDPAFAALKGGWPILRFLLFCALGATGALLAPQVGTGILPRGLKQPLATTALVAASVALAIVALDRLSGVTEPAAGFASVPFRVMYFGLRCFTEEILYRLFLCSTLVWLLQAVRQSRPGAGSGTQWLAVLGTQVVLVASTAVSAGASPFAHPAYDAFRFVAPGIVWGYLYLRYGLAISMTAQPLPSLAE